ncbi:S28 family serine protease [Legionella sp. km772]|uniref:S28 family serine protease n=1 Tax=Legionella sp. km772 TaxID=2498111 RepID=UPI000F8E0783|nr:S28 family serine protease [Legionella sp. km772]RUR12721.1 septum formation initiator [Legionella sp. km772]
MMNLKNIFGGLLLASFCNLNAGPVTHFFHYYQEQQASLSNSPIKQLTFQQSIDHQHPYVGHFAQRYYIDESFSNQRTDPVFFYICGESTCTARALTGAIRDYAKQHHAKLVALEHRYYGESLPFNSFSRDKLKYLSTEAALEDLARFQEYMMSKQQWQGTWIAFGGSYPGSLAAYYRLRYPQQIAGALASSAPVMAKEDFYEYDAHINKVVGPQCANQMRQVTQVIESSLLDENQFNQIKTLFAAQEVKDPTDFLYLVADTGAAAVQYGMKTEFCRFLAQSASPLEGYAAFAKQLYQRMNVNAVEMTAQGALSENPADYHNGAGMRQWFYQSCTEYGYWQNANHDPAQASRSSLINLTYHRQICERLFALHEPAPTASLNAKFYYPLMDNTVSNIYFTNGEHDPWSSLSLTEQNGNANNPNFTYYLIKGAAHCDDLHSPNAQDSLALKAARRQMGDLLIKWLNEAKRDNYYPVQEGGF